MSNKPYIDTNFAGSMQSLFDNTYDPYASFLAEQEARKNQQAEAIAATPKEEGRTWGEAASDTGAAVMGGFASLGGSLTHLGDTVTGGVFDIGAREAFDNASKFWEDAKSDELKRQKAVVHEADGFVDTVGAMVVNPATIADLLAGSLPHLLPVGIAAKAGKGLALAQGMKAEPLTAEAAAALGARAAGVATTTGMVTGGVLEGADAGSQAYNDAIALAKDKTPEELISVMPAYKKLIDEGMSHEDAVAGIAYRAGLTAQMVATPIAILASKVTGAAKLEADLFTGAGIKGWKNGALGVAREGVEEVVQEGGNRFGQNVGVNEFADPTRGYGDDVADSAAMGLVAGVSQGGGIYGLNAVLGRGANSANAQDDSIDDGIDSPTDGSSPSPAPLQLQHNPERMITMPDGTTAWESELADLGTESAAKQHPAYASPIVSTGDQSNPDDRFKFELNTESLRSRIQNVRARRREEMNRVNRTVDFAPIEIPAAQPAEVAPQNIDAIEFTPPALPEANQLTLAPLEQSAYDNGVDFAPAPDSRTNDLAAGVEQAISRNIDSARNARMPENLKDTRLLRNRYRTHLSNVADSLESNAAAFSSPDSLLDMAAKNGGLNAEAWAKEGVDPADAKLVNNASYAKAFRQNGGMTPDDLAEFAAQRGFSGFANAQGAPDADAALNAINEELAGKKRYSAEDETALQAAQSAPAYISELKEFGSPEAIKRAITLALDGKNLGENQLRIVQEVLNNTNAHSRDDKTIKEKWADRAKTMLANRGNKELNSWRNRDEHEADTTTHEAALNELMTDAIENYGIDPDAVKNAYRTYAEKYPTQGQLTAAMTSWVSANKPNTSEHLSYERQNRKAELPRGSSGQRGAALPGAGLSLESESRQEAGAPRVDAPSTPAEPRSDSAGRDAGLRQSVDSGTDENQLPPLTEGFEKSLLRARPLAKKLGIPNYNQMKLAELVPAIKAKYSEKSKAEAQDNQEPIKKESPVAARVTADSVEINQEPVKEKPKSIEGKNIDGDWAEFSDNSGSLKIPRAEMPQIKAEHRGAMVNFLNARGVEHQEENVPAESLKPTQAEFSREKVAKAKGFEGGNRSILISSDNHVLDGHHQWMAARDNGEDVKVIRLDAPIKKLVDLAHEFPSSTTDAASEQDQSTDSSESLATTESKQTEKGTLLYKLDTKPSQVETPSFKRWFGDSKVVDAEGKPLVVYHGTNSDFTAFDVNRIGARDEGFFGSGIYATPDLAEAETYAEGAVDDDGGGEIAMPLFMSIKNPFYWDTSSPEKTEITRAALASFGIKGIDLSGMGNLPNSSDRRKFNAAVRRSGYDGVLVIRDGGAGIGVSIPLIAEVVAFAPEQIKSATGNNGDFDPANPDIRYKVDGAPTKSISRESAQAVIDRISKDWKVKVKINLIGSIDELPDSVKSRLHKADDEQGEPAALIDESTGHVYINLSKAASERSIEELIFHEVYTHFGLRQLMGAKVSGLMTRLYLNLGKSQFDAMAKKYGVNTEAYREAYKEKPEEYVQAILAEELLAHMAEHPRPAIVRIANEFIGAVRAWLRESGFMELASISENDMRYLLKQSRETVTKGKQGNITGLIYSLAGISKADRKAINAERNRAATDESQDGERNANEDLITMWATISRDKESFKLPFSRKKDFVEIADDLEKDNKFKTYEAPEFAEMSEHGAEKSWRIAIPEKGKAAVYQKGNKVWIDVSDLEQGDGGKRIYNIAANYAFNNGLTFMGDPAGLKLVAQSRRLENMLSSALKFGTTDHLQPHKLQLISRGGVPALKWKKGDTENNILEMIRASYESVKNQFPEIENMVYNPETSKFQYRDSGKEVTKDDLNNLAAAARAFDGGTDSSVGNESGGDGSSGKITAGRTTIERAILTGSILRGTSSEVSRLLDKLSEQRSERLTGDNAILYSLPNTETRSQGGFSVSELGKKIPYFGERIAREEQTQSLPPSMQESFSRLGQNKTFIDKFTSEVKRQLTPAGLLPAPVFDLKVLRDGEINGDGMQTKHTLQGFYDAVEKAYGMPYKDLKRGTKREINKVLRGEPNAQLSPSVISALGKMRDDIKRLSAIHIRQLAEDAADLQAQGKDAEAASKLAMLETISQNFDTYLHRSYRAFDDKNWPDKVPADVYKNAVDFLASEYANGGAVTPDILAKAKVRVEAILTVGTAFDSMGAFITEGKLGAKDLSIMKKRKDVPAPIRALLGEYEDAAMNYVKSVTKMSRLVHNHAFLISMKQAAFDLGIISETEGEGMTKKIAADASEAYAPLNGLYTTREFEQALKDVMGKHNPIPIYDAIVAVNGMVKMGKTVLAPTTAMRNFMSSLFFTLSNGHFNYSHAAKSFKAAQVYFMERGDQGVKDYMIKLRRLGVIYDSPYASEMMDLMKDAKLEGFIESGGNPLANGAKWALQWSQKFYSFGDDFYKIIGFENEKAMLMKHRGLTEAQAEKEAAERIRNTYPTYSMIGKGVNALRRFPLVGTFVSFPAEIIRTSYNITKYLKDDIAAYGLKDPIVQRKLAGYAIAAGLISGISMLSAAIAGVDDDDEDVIRALAPKWQKNSTFLWLWKDENGNRVYVDLSFLDPYGYWKRPITAAMRNQPLDKAVLSGATDLLSPFLSWDIAAKAIGESAFNGKVEGGEVYNEADSSGGIALSVTNHLRKAAQPGFVTNIERFILAGMGEKSKTGKPYKTSEEVAALFGWRAATFDPKVALYYQSADYQDSKRDASTLLTRVAANVNDVSDGELRSAYEQSMRAREKAFVDMERIVSAAKSSGMSNLQLLGTLRSSGISVADARALISGKPPVFAPSKTMMKGAIKKSAVLFDAETQAEFKRREKYLNDLRSKSGAAHLLDSD